MALIRQRNNRPFTFSSTPESADAQYVRKELERLAKWFDQRLQDIQTTDSTESGIISTSRGGLGADFSQVPTFSVPYTTQPGAFGWVVSSAFSLGLLRSNSASEWRDALGVSGLESVPPNSVVSRFDSSAGSVQFATLGTGLEFNSGQLKVSGALSQFSALLASNNDVLQYKTGVWTNRTVSQYWSDILAAVSTPYTSLPFLMASGRLLGRTSILPGQAEEISTGNSISLSAGVLDTIQDIRTTATPTFAGLTSPIGSAAPNTGAFTDITMTVNGSTAVGSRGAFRSVLNGTDGSSWGFMSASTIASGGGTTSLGVEGGTDRANAPRLRIVSEPNAAQVTLISDASGAATALPLRIVTPTATALSIQVGSGVTVGQFTSTGINSTAIGATTPSTGKFTTLQTDAPSGGSSQIWKLGNYTAGAAAQVGKVRVEIAGVAYDLLTA